MGCKPDGDVCKLKTMSCNSSCDCCAGNCETQDTCKQDNVGVPRCAAAQCAAAGAACASSANCCGGMPCVPNPVAGGAPPYVCAGTGCISRPAACCEQRGSLRRHVGVIASGSTHGVCGPCGGPGGGDGGTSEAMTAEAAADPTAEAAPVDPEGGTGTGPGPTCALYGQLCTNASQCCNGVPCDGRCEFPMTR